MVLNARIDGAAAPDETDTMRGMSANAWSFGQKRKSASDLVGEASAVSQEPLLARFARTQVLPDRDDRFVM